MKKYESLKLQYPEYVSLNQLYKICKIAKRTALYLVKNKIIPCVENKENNTWRYKISIDDVITYLRKREQIGNMIPKGAIKNKYAKKEKPTLPAILTNSKKIVKSYFVDIFKFQPDVLDTLTVSTMTGLKKQAIRNFIRDGFLKALLYNNVYIIPKEFLIEFVLSEKYLTFRCYSEDYKKIITDFEIWSSNKNNT